MTTVTHINEAKALEAHASLVTALGTENNPAQWMVFMEAVELHLPLMASAGRPTQKEIQASLIGELGFKSWRDMLEAPVSDKGLAWSYNSWKAWLKAWNVVKEASYLRNEPLTASAINKLKRDFETLPETKEALKAEQGKRAAEKEQVASETLTALKGRVSELERGVSEREAKIGALTEINRELVEKLAAAQPEKVSRWGYLKRFFTG